MMEYSFERLSFTSRKLFCKLVYPKIEEKPAINAFYASLAEKLRAFGEKAEGEGIVIRMTSAVRFFDEKKLYITFDLLMSRSGEVKYYARHAQGWTLENERLLSGGNSFFDGEKYIKITNLFGRMQSRRMSDYIVESEIKPRKR